MFSSCWPANYRNVRKTCGFLSTSETTGSTADRFNRTGARTCRSSFSWPFAYVGQSQPTQTQSLGTYRPTDPRLPVRLLHFLYFHSMHFRFRFKPPGESFRFTFLRLFSRSYREFSGYSANNTLTKPGFRAKAFQTMISKFDREFNSLFFGKW
ncbi:unnamed protein product, partial [Nesidiocoris tenuis]